MEVIKLLSDADGENKCRQEYRDHGHKCTMSFSEVPFTIVAKIGHYHIKIRLARTNEKPSWAYIVFIQVSQDESPYGDAVIAQLGGFGSYIDALNTAISDAERKHAEFLKKLSERD